MLFALARRLRLVEWIDEVVPKRQQGLSVGTDILLAVLNRVLAPCSQAQWVDWYHRTARYHDVPVRDQGPNQPAFLGPYELPHSRTHSCGRNRLNAPYGPRVWTGSVHGGL